MNGDLMYQTFRTEQRMRLEDPSASHRRALRPRRLPRHHRAGSATRAWWQARLHRAPAMEPDCVAT